MITKLRALALALAAGSFLVFLEAGISAETAAFHVIVNAQNPVTKLDRFFLADVFMKRVTRWPNHGGTIQPVDLAEDSEARREFSATVFNRSVAGIKSYWQQLIFSGRDVPPPELPSEKEVIQYVLKDTRAIGYVSQVGNVDGVKTIEIK